MISFRKYPGYLSFKILGFDFFIAKNKENKFRNRIFDLNKSLIYFPKRHQDLDTYYKALSETNMLWTDNIYKQFRMLSFLQLVRQAFKNNPNGTFMELGVWKGLSAYMMIKTIEDKGKTARFILADSFEGGLSDKVSQDRNPLTNQSTQEILREKKQFHSTQEDLERSLMCFKSEIEIIPGWIPSSLVKMKFQSPISFIHFDMDLYEPTIESLRFLWSNLLSNGIVVFDDYNSTQFPGVTKAVQEFILLKNDEIEIFYEVPFGSAFLVKK